MPHLSLRHPFRRNLLLLALVLLFVAVVSQEQYHIAKLGVNEGLSQGSAFDLMQDDKGFIWIATADGLNRFDGHRFEVFTGSLTDTFPFALTRLRNLFHTKDVLWITSAQAMVLTRIDLVSGKSERIFDFAAQSSYGYVSPFHLAGDTMWSLVMGEGVVAISVSQRKILERYPEAHNSFPANSMRYYDPVAQTIWYTNLGYTQLCSFSLADKTFRCKAFLQPGTNDTLTVCSLGKAADGTLRIGSDGSLIAYDPSADTMRMYPLATGSETPGIITCVLCPDESVTWCGSNGGFVYAFDERTKRSALQSDPAVTVNGVGHRIVAMMMDRSKNLWVGTDPAGLLRIDTKQKPFNHVWHKAGSTDGLKSNFMKCFAQLGNEMLIGTYDRGINVLDMRTGAYRYINGFGETAPVIYNIAVDSSQHVWAGTGEGTGIVEPGSSWLTRPLITEGDAAMLSRVAQTIFVNKDGTVLVGCVNGLVTLQPKAPGYAIDSINVNTNVHCFYNDREGRLWMGSTLALYCSESGDPHALQVVVPNTGLVKCLYHSEDGVMWAGTDHGLCRIDAANHRVSKTYTEQDGLPNTFIYGILPDEEGRLWISTNKGLTRFDPQHETFRNYSITDGLQSNEFNTNAFCRTTGGEMYFGGINGFNHFYPEEIKDNPFVPQCVITGFKIFDKPYALDSSIEYKSHITLDYTNNNLLLEYTGMEFSDPARNRFRYRLLGLDTNWVEADDARFARFVNLDPGQYTFQLTAANNDGVWNNVPKELRIIITPPFWKTAAFIVSVSVIALLLVVLGVRLYFRRQLSLKTRELQLQQGARMSAIIETEEKERKRVAEELHDGLGQLLSTARLNISGIGSDLREKDTLLWQNSLDLLDEACSEVRLISHNMMPGALIRSGLIEAIDDLVSKINAAGKLEVVFDTELNERFPETIEVAMYRITQEVLNNMIRHAEASRVQISLERTDAVLKITIADNGKSFDVASIPGSEGIGWKNIYSRVEMLNGNLQVTSEKEKGTSVFLSVPLS